MHTYNDSIFEKEKLCHLYLVFCAPSNDNYMYSISHIRLMVACILSWIGNKHLTRTQVETIGSPYATPGYVARAYDFGSPGNSLRTKYFHLAAKKNKMRSLHVSSVFTQALRGTAEYCMISGRTEPIRSFRRLPIFSSFPAKFFIRFL